MWRWIDSHFCTPMIFLTFCFIICPFAVCITLSNLRPISCFWFLVFAVVVHLLIFTLPFLSAFFLKQMVFKYFKISCVSSISFPGFVGNFILYDPLFHRASMFSLSSLRLHISLSWNFLFFLSKLLFQNSVLIVFWTLIHSLICICGAFCTSNPFY